MWKNLLTLLISVSLCAAVLWWLAPLLSPSADTDFPDYGQLVAYDPGRRGGHLKPDIDQWVLGDRQGEGVRWITNGDGFRNRDEITDEPADGVLRILFVGDSFVDGMRTDQDHTIGAVLERELSRRLEQPVEVVISGHNNPANAWYHWQTHGRHLNPQLVLIGLTIGNDLTSHNFGAGVFPVNGPFDRLIEVDPAAPQAGVGDAAVMIPEQGFLPADQRSRWTRWRVAANRALAERSYLLAQRAPPAMGPRPGSPGQAQAAGFFISLGLYYKGSIPFIESVWRDFETLLPGFVAQVRHFGARPLMVTFPTRIEALPRDWNRLADALQLDPAQFDLLAPFRRLSALCASIELPCLDTSAALRKGQAKAEVFRPLGDMHLSVFGQAVTGSAIASFIENLLPAEPAEVPGEDWLENYHAMVDRWAIKSVETGAPWLDRQTGVARLNPTDHRDALTTVLTRGWQSAEDADPFWSVSSHASIRIPVIRKGVDYLIELNARPFLAQANGYRQRMIISLNGGAIQERVLDQDRFAMVPLKLPAARMLSPWSRLDIEFPDAVVPAEIGESADRRHLGVAVIGLDIVPIEP